MAKQDTRFDLTGNLMTLELFRRNGDSMNVCRSHTHTHTKHKLFGFSLASSIPNSFALKSFRICRRVYIAPLLPSPSCYGNERRDNKLPVEEEEEENAFWRCGANRLEKKRRAYLFVCVSSF